MARATRKAATDAAAKKETLVYVGPNLRGDLMISRFTAYRGGLPGQIAARCSADNNFSRLFVPVAELAAARARCGTRGDVLAKAFAAVLKTGGRAD